MSQHSFYFFFIGTGCARGFLSAMDAGWMIRDWCLGESFSYSNNIARYFRTRMKPKLDHNWSSSYSQAGQNANQGQHSSLWSHWCKSCFPALYSGQTGAGAEQGQDSSLGLIGTNHAFPPSPPARTGADQGQHSNFRFPWYKLRLLSFCSQTGQDPIRVSSTLACGLIACLNYIS